MKECLAFRAGPLLDARGCGAKRLAIEERPGDLGRQCADDVTRASLLDHRSDFGSLHGRHCIEGEDERAG